MKTAATSMIPRTRAVAIRVAAALAVGALGALAGLIPAGALPPVVDLNSTAPPVTIFGDSAADNTGSAITTGDINGDGLDDAIFGAFVHASSTGRTYIEYGQPHPDNLIDLDVDTADVTVIGDDPNDASATSLATGNINGDGYDDLIIGAPNATPAGGSQAGEVYVVYGGPSLPATINLGTTPAGFTVYGDDVEDHAGFAVSSGNVNGDAYDDIIIGARDANPAGGFDAGETYVIYGSASLPASRDLNSTPADVTIYGDDSSDAMGAALATGRINADAFDDIVIGAPGATPQGGIAAGEVYVIYGGGALPATIDLNSTSAGFTLFGNDAGDETGFSVAAADIDGDTYADVIAGAWGADRPARSGVGTVSVMYGGPGLPASFDLDDFAADFTIVGDNAGDNLGFSVAAADIEGDLIADIAVGAPGFDPAGGSTAGAAFVIAGDASLPAIIDLGSASATMSVLGNDALDQAGRAVALGDLNGDNGAEVIIGAPSADGSGAATFCGPGQVGDRCTTGDVYVVLGEGPDADGDGLPDTYESANPGCLNINVPDGNADPDLDTLTNLQEFNFETDPCDDDPDADGCSDPEEIGPDEDLGGQRDPNYFWDFYDVTNDKVIDLNDTIDILGLFGDPGTSPSANLRDRDVPNLAFQWLTVESNTGIDLNDAVFSLASFGADCTAAP